MQGLHVTVRIRLISLASAESKFTTRVNKVERPLMKFHWLTSCGNLVGLIACYFMVNLYTIYFKTSTKDVRHQFDPSDLMMPTLQLRAEITARSSFLNVCCFFLGHSSHFIAYWVFQDRNVFFKSFVGFLCHFEIASSSRTSGTNAGIWLHKHVHTYQEQLSAASWFAKFQIEQQQAVDYRLV